MIGIPCLQVHALRLHLDRRPLKLSAKGGGIAAREYCLDHVAVQVVHQQYSEVLT